MSKEKEQGKQKYKRNPGTRKTLKEKRNAKGNK